MDHRQVINGVLWRTRTGAPWRDLPVEYGNWKTIYHRHRRWSADGTWARVLAGLRLDCDRVGPGEWTVGVDSTVVRAHQHAAGARRRPPKDVPAAVLAPAVLRGGLDRMTRIRSLRGRNVLIGKGLGAPAVV